MTDHVDLLRVAATFPCDPRHKQLLLESADEIKRLRKALKPFKKFADEYVSEGFHDTEPMEEAGGAFVWKNFQDVIKALEGK